MAATATASKSTQITPAPTPITEVSSLTPVPGRPQEQFEVQEAGTAEEDDVVYPSGLKLWLNLISFMAASYIRGLDLTIVSVVVPSLTNEFKTINDIGWYGAAYGMTSSATVFFFGKVYTVFDVKRTYLSSFIVFCLGSVICTFAQSSKMFIFGRALAGFGSAWQGAGMVLQVNMMFPLAKRPTYLGVLNFTGSAGLVSAPLIGGLLTQRFGWRACFGINIPLNTLCFAFSAYSMQSTTGNSGTNLSLREKLKRLDLLGSLIFVPALTCLLMALQWGGIKYGWRDPRIIALLTLSALLLAVFTYLQYYLGDRATVPPRIVMQRSVLAGAWFLACCDGTLAVTEQYLTIYYQGVRGLSPARSGLLGVGLVAGLCMSSLVSGYMTTWLGYCSVTMVATTVLAPIASGLLTTLSLDSQVSKAAGLLGMLGFSLGLGMSGPLVALSCVLGTSDISIGSAVLGFGAGMGSAVFNSAAALLFQNRLADEVRRSAPGTNVTTIEHAGLSEIRNKLGEARLKQVLIGYDKAVVQTLYLPLALTLLTAVGSSLTEWRSVKKKQS